MNVREQYLKRVAAELGSNLFITEMPINNVQWTYCYFLSTTRPIIYMLCISTGSYELQRKLYNEAFTRVAKSDPLFFDFEKQSTELLVETNKMMKQIYDEKDIPIYNKCIKIHNGGNYHEILKAVINVDALNKRIITKVIKDFINANESYWQASKPIIFTDNQLARVFN